GRRKFHGPARAVDLHVDVAPGAGPQLPLPADLRTIERLSATDGDSLMNVEQRTSNASRRMTGLLCSWNGWRMTFLLQSVTVVWAILECSIASSAEPEKPDAAVLHLTNGNGFVTGALKNSGGPARLGWQSPLFTAPFDFDVNLVNAVHFPLPDRLP